MKSGQARDMPLKTGFFLLTTVVLKKCKYSVRAAIMAAIVDPALDNGAAGLMYSVLTCETITG